MVEVFVLSVPLDGEIVLAGSVESLVLWGEVLQAALRRDEVVGSLIRSAISLVLEGEAEWEPSLLDLWVRVGSCLEVSVDLVKNGMSALVLGVKES